MPRFKMIGACPIEIDGRWIMPGDADFDADLPAEKLAFFTQIGAISVAAPKADPKPLRIVGEK